MSKHPIHAAHETLIEMLQVGTSVLILVGMWQGTETVITEIIETAHTDTRYDVACAPGRWYYPCELQVIVEAIP